MDLPDVPVIKTFFHEFPPPPPKSPQEERLKKDESNNPPAPGNFPQSDCSSKHTNGGKKLEVCIPKNS